MKTSGRIKLIDRKEFHPGEEGNVGIVFLNRKYLGDDFGVGKVFFFGEGSKFLGEGRVIQILE